MGEDLAHKGLIRATLGKTDFKERTRGRKME